MLNERKLKKEIEGIYRSDIHIKEYDLRYRDRDTSGVNKSKSNSKSREREKDKGTDMKQTGSKLKSNLTIFVINIAEYPNYMINSKLNSRLLNSYFNNNNTNNLITSNTPTNSSKIIYKSNIIKSKYPVPKVIN